MKGGYLHDFIIRRLETGYLRIGAVTHREYPVRRGQHSPAVDLLAEVNGRRIANEVELSPRRVPGDITKAAALNADLLLIVTPRSRAVRRCRFGFCRWAVPCNDLAN